jgi:hypothetical protein
VLLCTRVAGTRTRRRDRGEGTRSSAAKEADKAATEGIAATRPGIARQRRARANAGVVTGGGAPAAEGGSGGQ